MLYSVINNCWFFWKGNFSGCKGKTQTTSVCMWSSTLSNWSTIEYILYSEIKIAVRLCTFRYIVEYNGLHALYSEYLFYFHDIIINDDMLRSSQIFFYFGTKYLAQLRLCVTLQDSAPSVFILCSTWFPFRQTPPRPIYFYFPLLKYIIYCLDRKNQKSIL